MLRDLVDGLEWRVNEGDMGPRSDNEAEGGEEGVSFFEVRDEVGSEWVS